MVGDKRRIEILKRITKAKRPINASRLAESFNVSRQIIVGDVALLRANGHEIIATSRGYLLNSKTEGYFGQVAVHHSEQDTEKELRLLVGLGVEIVDVTIEHMLYGHLTGQLNITNNDDIDLFLGDLEQHRASLLSTLTNGVHLHTLKCSSEDAFKEACAALDRAGYLYQNN